MINAKIRHPSESRRIPATPLPCLLPALPTLLPALPLIAPIYAPVIIAQRSNEKCQIETRSNLSLNDFFSRSTIKSERIGLSPSTTPHVFLQTPRLWPSAASAAITVDPSVVEFDGYLDSMFDDNIRDSNAA